MLLNTFISPLFRCFVGTKCFKCLFSFSLLYFRFPPPNAQPALPIILSILLIPAAFTNNKTPPKTATVNNLSQIPMHRSSKRFSSVFLIVSLENTSKSLVSNSISDFFRTFNPAGTSP